MGYQYSKLFPQEGHSHPLCPCTCIGQGSVSKGTYRAIVYYYEEVGLQLCEYNGWLVFLVVSNNSNLFVHGACLYHQLSIVLPVSQFQ